MALIEFASLYPQVLPDVKGCPAPLMLNAIRNAAIKFCEETHAWEAVVDPVGMIANVSEYEIDQPLRQRIIRISQVIGAQGQMFFQTEADMDAQNRNWRLVTGSTPTIPVMINPRLMRVYPIPTATGEIISLKAIVKPSPDSVSIEDYIYDDYYMGIAAGAKADLCAMPGKSWSKPEMVGYYQSLFDNDVTVAKLKRAGGYSGTQGRARYQRFGG